MTLEIGAWVKWTEISPTRLGYAASAIGKVVGVRDHPAKAREIDVEFNGGDIVRGAFEQWFEAAQTEEPDDDHQLEQQ